MSPISPKHLTRIHNCTSTLLTVSVLVPHPSDGQPVPFAARPIFEMGQYVLPPMSEAVEISSVSTDAQAEKGRSIRVRVGRKWRKRTGIVKEKRLVGISEKDSPWWLFEQRAEKGVWDIYVYEKRNLERWLKDLPDSTELNKLYIPGTHESLAIHGFPISSCQSFPIMTQLEAGHRFLDLRFALKKNKLVGYHGMQNQYITAEEVVEVLYEFLRRNPSECIIVSVKQENGAKMFEDRMWELCDSKKWLWYDEDRWPTLGEVRGKCVMMTRFAFTQRRGIHPAYWPDNSSKAWEGVAGVKPIVVQDWYSIGSFLAIPEKANLALSLFRPLQRYNSSIPSVVQSPTPLRLNFLSGATLLTAFPFVVAKGLGWVTLFGMGVKGVNQRVLDALLRMEGEDRMRDDFEGDGMVVLMDYYEVPGGLAELLISWNFR